MKDEYLDLINKKHHVSFRHRAMSVHDRAGQFASFAALVGYEDFIGEAGRYTEEEIELGEDDRMQLDRSLQKIMERIGEIPEAEITYFVPDEKKGGGSYRTLISRIKWVDLINQCICLSCGEKIGLKNILHFSVTDSEHES